MMTITSTLLCALLMLLGMANYVSSNSVGWHHGSSGSGSYEGDSHAKKSPCCPHTKGGHCDCLDPCVLDPPDVFINPLEGIPTDDESLEILVNLTWPIKDVTWYVNGYMNTVILVVLGSNGYQNQVILSQGKYTDDEISAINIFSQAALLVDILNALKTDTTKQQTSAMEKGEKDLKEKDELEQAIRNANITFQKGSATLKHQLGFSKTDPISTEMARLGYMANGASRRFMKRMNFKSPSSVGLVFFGPLPTCDQDFSDLKRPVLVESCDPNSPFRTADGSCNNVANVLWGASFTPFRRDLAPVYDDGISDFRKSEKSKKLPSARLVSTTVNNARSEKSQTFSILHMTYAQFIDHDLTSAPLSRASFAEFEMSESPILCCDVEKELSHPECATIKIPKDDPFYGCFDERCMEFVRSAPAEGNCYQGPRQQTNQLTAYLDGSVIYGARPSATNELRSFVNGLMNAQLMSDGQILLPRARIDEDGECNTPEREALGQFCFLAGDNRANEQILLTFFQTLWHREHNRVATILRGFNNEDWDDERIFQETRRIVVAQLQQVTFGEFLSTIIGPTLMASSRLNPLEGDQQTTDYNDQIDASIANSFASSAYRFGHSLIADNLLFVTKGGETTPRELSTLFFNPFELYRRDGMCELAQGSIRRPEDMMDAFFTQEVTGKLFRGSQPFGLDLVALNIQRGRDHGLPPYNSWRVFCGLPKAENFDDLEDQMSQDRIDALKEVYENVNDIDLFIGGVSENPVPGALLGHTFTCIIHNQFFRLRFGDRYWFEYRDGPGNFTGAQLKQLHNVTLARIMCNNLPELDYIQRWPLRNSGPDNPRVCCKSIRQYNLNPWNLDFTEEDHDHTEDSEWLGEHAG